MGFIREILGDDHLTIERKSAVWMFERYFDWPLRFSSIFRLPLPILLAVGRDFLKRKRAADDSFKDFVVERYGETIYQIFFHPYTEKFLKISGSETSSDWAITGIERAVIDKKIRLDDLLGLAKSVLIARPPLKFIYPKVGGIGRFGEILAQRIIANGGTILLGSAIDEIKTTGDKIKAVTIRRKAYPCDFLIWTGPLTEITELLKLESVKLDYMQLILYNYRVDHPSLLGYQWCYYGGKDTPFNRVSVPSLFSPANAPEGKTGLCAEVTCNENDALWNDPNSIEPDIRRSLRQVGLIQSETAINDLSIERIENAYPIYDLGYRDRLLGNLAELNRFKNLRLLGRTGTFWYNNMDHYIEAALKVSRELTGTSRL
jgi:protoporphyrinogen oxidase